MHLSRQENCRSIRCSWCIACRRCSNYIFILDSTSGFKVFGKGSHETVRGSFKCWDLVLCSVVWSPVPSKLVHVHKAAYVNENTGLMDTNTQVEAQLDSAPKPEIGVCKNFGVTWYQKTVFQDGGNWTLKFPNSSAPPVIGINIRKIPPECRYIPNYQVEDATEILIRHRGVTIRLATIRYISRYTTHDMVHDTIQNQLIYYQWKILKHCGMCHQYCYIKTVILARNSEFKINKDVHNHPCPKYLLLNNCVCKQNNKIS